MIATLTFNSDHDMSSPPREFAPSKVAFLTASIFWLGDMLLYPLDAISTRLKGTAHTDHNSIKFMWDTIKTSRSQLYKGSSISLFHSFGTTCLYIYAYESLMKKMSDTIDQYTDQKQLKLLFPFFISASVEIACLHLDLPFLTLRSRVQMDPMYEFKGILAGLKEIAQKEGFGRFYKASKLLFVHKTLNTALQFQTYQMIRYYLGPSVSIMLLNCLVSTAVSVLIGNPLEVMITRYALTDTTKKTLHFSSMVKQILEKQGIRGFYKGFMTEMLIGSVFSLFVIPIFQIARERYGVNLSQ